MHHIKQPGRYTGWIEVDGERFEVDGWTGGRDRTFGVRVGQEIDFWLWFDGSTSGGSPSIDGSAMPGPTLVAPSSEVDF